jgi:deazaflavin-dependent oxidoreductase (nitroreductase family)
MGQDADAEFLHLTTTGRRSGQPREVELWFTWQGGHDYVIAEEGERAHWVRNLLADPRVAWRVGERRLTGRARVVDGALGAAVRALSAAKYGWGDGLVVELAPPGPAVR